METAKVVAPENNKSRRDRENATNGRGKEMRRDSGWHVTQGWFVSARTWIICIKHR